MFCRLILFFLLSCSVQLALAQHHVIKGRIFALPGDLKISSLAIGYEQIFNNRCAAQLLFSRGVVNMQETDGGKDVFLTLTPEFKRYFRPLEAVHKSAYLAAFLEMREYLPNGGGHEVYADDLSPIILHSVERSLAPGLLIGQNLHFSKKWYLEVYTGPLYRFGRTTDDLQQTGIRYTERQRFSHFGWRFGLNLAFKF